MIPRVCPRPWRISRRLRLVYSRRRRGRFCAERRRIRSAGLELRLSCGARSIGMGRWRLLAGWRREMATPLACRASSSGRRLPAAPMAGSFPGGTTAILPSPVWPRATRSCPRGRRSPTFHWTRALTGYGAWPGTCAITGAENLAARGTGGAGRSGRLIRAPAGEEDSDFRAVRGGCWSSPLERARAAARFGNRPGDRWTTIGVRVVGVLAGSSRIRADGELDHRPFEGRIRCGGRLHRRVVEGGGPTRKARVRCRAGTRCSPKTVKSLASIMLPSVWRLYMSCKVIGVPVTGSVPLK